MSAAAEDTRRMTLEGWDHIPRGYGAEFVLDDAPWWLRFWFHTPFIDCYAHPKVVARGHAFLIPHPNWPESEREVPGPGWRVRPPDYLPPGAEYGLRAAD
jgi:hypothetical protein